MDYDFNLKHSAQAATVCSYTLSTKSNPALEDRSQAQEHAHRSVRAWGALGPTSQRLLKPLKRRKGIMPIIDSTDLDTF